MDSSSGRILRTRGFLPETDSAHRISARSEFAVLDDIGRDLPSLLSDRGFRQYARALKIPLWPDSVRPEELPVLRLYYVSRRLPGIGVYKWSASPRRRYCREPRGPSMQRLPSAEAAANSQLRWLCPLQLEAISQGGSDHTSVISTRSRISSTSTTNIGSSSSISKSKRSQLGFSTQSRSAIRDVERCA